jgi:predicted MFS family arabinose efflux permease
MAVYRTAMNIGEAVGSSVMTVLTEAYGYVSGFTESGVVMIIPLVLMTRLNKSQNQ